MGLHPSPHRVPDLTRAVNSLVGVLQDPVCGTNMNKSAVVGFLGEVIVRKVLADCGYKVDHLGNQAGKDLALPELGLTIDVKCSTLKSEFGTGFAHWGWQLHGGARKRPIACSHFVCVALDDRHEASRFYVLNARDLPRFPAASGRYNARHALVAAVRDDDAIPQHRDRPFLMKCRRLVRDGVASAVRPNARELLRALRAR